MVVGSGVTRRGVVRCAAAAALFGASAPAASRLTGRLPAFTLAGLLYLGAAVAVLPFAGRARPTAASVRRGAGRLAVAVVLGGAVGPALLAAGLGRTPAATASLLLNLELVFTMVVAGLFFGEHLGGRLVLGTAAVLGASTMVGWSADVSLRWGTVLIAGACACWALDNCVTAALDELAPAHITLVKGVIAGSANVAIGVAGHGVPGGWPVLGALAIGATGYGASITLWVAGARDLGAARGQLVFATGPFIGAAVAWTVFAEPVTARQLGAVGIAVAGVGIVLRSDHTHLHTHEPVEHEHEHTHDDGHHHHHHHHEGQPGAAVVTGGPGLRHSHRHVHSAVEHRHAHVPDLHHRHEHR